MKKKILLGSILVIVLMLSTPMISNISAKTTVVSEEKETEECSTCSSDDNRCVRLCSEYCYHITKSTEYWRVNIYKWSYHVIMASFFKMQLQLSPRCRFADCQC